MDVFIIIILLIYLYFRCISNCWEGIIGLFIWFNNVCYIVERRGVNVSDVVILLYFLIYWCFGLKIFFNY